MVSFACKEVRIDEIIKCSFSLSKTEYRVFSFLLKHTKHFAINEISNNLNLDRSTVQKAVKGLVNRGLLLRLQRNLPKGSYVFTYKTKDKDKIKKVLRDIIKKWCISAEETINEL